MCAYLLPTPIVVKRFGIALHVEVFGDPRRVELELQRGGFQLGDIAPLIVELPLLSVQKQCQIFFRHHVFLIREIGRDQSQNDARQKRGEEFPYIRACKFRFTVSRHGVGPQPLGIAGAAGAGTGAAAAAGSGGGCVVGVLVTVSEIEPPPLPLPPGTVFNFRTPIAVSTSELPICSACVMTGNASPKMISPIPRCRRETPIESPKWRSMKSPNPRNAAASFGGK